MVEQLSEFLLNFNGNFNGKNQKKKKEYTSFVPLATEAQTEYCLSIKYSTLDTVNVSAMISGELKQHTIYL